MSSSGSLIPRFRYLRLQIHHRVVALLMERDASRLVQLGFQRQVRPRTLAAVRQNYHHRLVDTDDVLAACAALMVHLSKDAAFVYRAATVQTPLVQSVFAADAT